MISRPSPHKCTPFCENDASTWLSMLLLFFFAGAFQIKLQIASIAYVLCNCFEPSLLLFVFASVFVLLLLWMLRYAMLLSCYTAFRYAVL